MEPFYHRPVLLEETIAGLDLKENGVYFDGTLGGGGHSSEILKRMPSARLIATDKDPDAIEAAKERLSPFGGRYEIYRSDFKNYEEVLGKAGADKLDGFLLDLGVSSHQIDDRERGFSYLADEAPLDMRMDPEAPLSAEDVVNGYPEEELARILKEYGEERYAGYIARKIAAARADKPLKTCGELKKLAESSYPAKFRTPACARQTFQAIRIEVNGELKGLGACIRGLIGRLKQGGRGCIITFHSLEDRIVKQVYRELSSGCDCPKYFPVCVCGKKKIIDEIAKKPLVATEEERRENPRSKSAKLRIARKCE